MPRSVDLQQIDRLDPERPRDPVEIVDRDRMQAPLDLRDVGPMDVGAMRQLFLAEPTLGSQPAHVPRHNVSDRA